MSVENYFLSRDGRNLINKICNFLETLIIKIDTEAKEEETKESYLKWLQYKYAYEKNDDIFNYEYGQSDISEAGISLSLSNSKNLLNKDNVFKLCQKKDSTALRLLEYLRSKCISEYVEPNTYYSQFQGIPRKGQEIYITNKDEIDGDPILINEVTLEKYPLTYDYLYMEGTLKTIKNDHPDYLYLNFIDNPISIYKVRSSQQFTILYYSKGILSDSELYNFFNAFNKTRVYIDSMVYVYGFENRYPMYSFLIEILLLEGTVLSFFNSYMDNYTLSNYSDQEIFDILDSYNLSSLKKVNIGVLRKIIKELPDLLEIKGSDLVIEKILDVVADNSITIKRYYLNKIYNVDAYNQTDIDSSKTYEENVDIVFKEKIIRKGAVSVEEGTQDYHTFVESDDTWGGNTEGMSSSDKREIKEKFRKEILQMDFSNILTKYLTISAAVDAYSKQIELHNMIGLIWQFCQNNEMDNFLVTDNLLFDSYTIRPIDLYAFICRLISYMNGYSLSTSDIINTKNMNIDDILVLRNIEGTSKVLTEIKDGKTKVILPESLGSKRIIDILGNDIDYNEYLVNFSSLTSLETIMSEYDKNALIISKIHDKWVDSSTLDEAMAWECLMEQNRTNENFYILFDGYERFSEFLNANCYEFSVYVNKQLSGSDFTYDYASILLNRATVLFRDYISGKTDEILELSTFDSSESSSDTVSYMKDLTLLFNEFLSIYTELHKIEYSQSISDYPYNKIKLLYYFTKEIIEEEYRDKLFIDMRQRSSYFFNRQVANFIKFVSYITDTIEDTYFDYIKLFYECIFDEVTISYNQSLNLNIDYNKMINYVIDNIKDELKLYDTIKESDISITLFVKNKIIDLTYKFIKEEYSNRFSDRISLEYKLVEDIVYEKYNSNISLKDNIKNLLN